MTLPATGRSQTDQRFVRFQRRKGCPCGGAEVFTSCIIAGDNNRLSCQSADGVGFEPTVRFRTLVFKTSAFVHSATHPCVVGSDDGASSAALTSRTSRATNAGLSLAISHIVQWFDKRNSHSSERSAWVSCSERRKELKRRRHRRQKVARIKRKSEKASVSEKAVLAGKLRQLTPGADAVIQQLGLEDR